MTANMKYEVRGDVRGTIHVGDDLDAAIDAMIADTDGCLSQSGYSDVVIYGDGEILDISYQVDGTVVEIESGRILRDADEEDDD